MAAKKWVMYGVSGALGLGVLAGAATLTASAMELHTNGGNVLDGGGVDAGTIGGADKVGDRPQVTPSPTPSDTSSAAPTTSATPSPGANTSTPDPAPPAPVPVDPASPISIPSAASAD